MESYETNSFAPPPPRPPPEALKLTEISKNAQAVSPDGILLDLLPLFFTTLP
jgi:hypothetical protein